jgi:hypothetical protein
MLAEAADNIRLKRAIKDFSLLVRKAILWITKPDGEWVRTAK